MKGSDEQPTEPVPVLRPKLNVVRTVTVVALGLQFLWMFLDAGVMRDDCAYYRSMGDHSRLLIWFLLSGGALVAILVEVIFHLVKRKPAKVVVPLVLALVSFGVAYYHLVGGNMIFTPCDKILPSLHRSLGPVIPSKSKTSRLPCRHQCQPTALIRHTSDGTLGPWPTATNSKQPSDRSRVCARK